MLTDARDVKANVAEDTAENGGAVERSASKKKAKKVVARRGEKESSIRLNPSPSNKLRLNIVRGDFFRAASTLDLVTGL